MSNPYTSVTITGYNSSPPPSDGSTGADNEVQWATIKEKLPDPLKTAIESINTNTAAAFGKVIGNGITSISTTYTVLSTDRGKIIDADTDGGAFTITLLAAATAGTSFPLIIRNAGQSGNTLTIDGDSAETVNGALTVALSDGAAIMIVSDGSNWIGPEYGRVPPGVIDMFAGATVPAGWLLCDGTAVDRTTYAALFDAIGTGFGSGDGSTTFNLPNGVGRSPIGVGTGDATNATAWSLGDKPTSGAGGEEDHTLTKAEVPTHVHTGATAGSIGNNAQSGASLTVRFNTGNASTGDGSADGLNGDAHNITHPVFAINYIIKT